MSKKETVNTDAQMRLQALKDRNIIMPASDEVMLKVLSDPMITILDHPMIQGMIAQLRSKKTGKRKTRALVKEIAVLGFYEMAWNLPLKMRPVTTPMCKTKAPRFYGKKPVLVEILRAGSAMVSGVEDALMPSAKIATIGEHRNPKNIKKPKVYFDKGPEHMDQREIFVLDPMLASGWSAARAIDILKKEHGCTKIHFMCIFAAYDGIKVLRERHPDVDLYVGVVDKKLNKKYYIIPGAGDMGDRIYGTTTKFKKQKKSKSKKSKSENHKSENSKSAGSEKSGSKKSKKSDFKNSGSKKSGSEGGKDADFKEIKDPGNKKSKESNAK